MASFDIRDHSIIFDLPRRVKDPYSWVEHIPFAFFLASFLKPKILVELGVHSGNSFNAFCQAVKKLGLNTKCYGVDTFKGDVQSGFYGESVYKDLLAYVQEEYGEFAVLIKKTFDEAAKDFSAGGIDLLHIDGYHTYKVIKHDFETWLPKMSERCVVLLHDTQVKEGNFGVWRLWQEISEESEEHSSFEFKHGHGLGVIGIGKKLNEDFIEMIKEFKSNLFYSNLFSRLGSSILKSIKSQ